MPFIKKPKPPQTVRKIVLGIGALLVALRLFFPVLQCTDAELTFCQEGRLAVFAIMQPIEGYQFHQPRTYTQAAGLAILAGMLYIVLKKEE